MTNGVNGGRTVSNADASWESDILESQQPVLLDFWGENCNQSQALEPALADLAESRPDLRVVKVNVFDQPVVAQHFGVQTIPTLLLVTDGEITGQVPPGGSDMLRTVVDEALQSA